MFSVNGTVAGESKLQSLGHKLENWRLWGSINFVLRGSPGTWVNCEDASDFSADEMVMYTCGCFVLCISA